MRSSHDPMILSDFAGMRCASPGCTAVHQEEMFMHVKCHPDEPTWTVVDYAKGTLQVRCSVCRRPGVTVLIARERGAVPEPPPVRVFYLTIGLMYRDEPHPQGLHPDAWVEIVAEDMAQAREAAFKQFGSKWAFMYSEEDFEREYHPRGCQLRLEAKDVLPRPVPAGLAAESDLSEGEEKVLP